MRWHFSCAHAWSKNLYENKEQNLFSDCHRQPVTLHTVISPRHDNFREMRNRKYRSSLDAAFSANVAFILFECEATPNRRIAALHQESFLCYVSLLYTVTLICHSCGYCLTQSGHERQKQPYSKFSGKISQNGRMFGGTVRLGHVQGEVRLCRPVSLRRYVSL